MLGLILDTARLRVFVDQPILGIHLQPVEDRCYLVSAADTTRSCRCWFLPVDLVSLLHKDQAPDMSQPEDVTDSVDDLQGIPLNMCQVVIACNR